MQLFEGRDIPRTVWTLGILGIVVDVCIGTLEAVWGLWAYPPIFFVLAVAQTVMLVMFHRRGRAQREVHQRHLDCMAQDIADIERMANGEVIPLTKCEGCGAMTRERDAVCGLCGATKSTS